MLPDQPSSEYSATPLIWEQILQRVEGLPSDRIEAFANLIAKQLEKEQEFRARILASRENQLIRDYRYRMTGLIAAFLVTLTFLGTATWLISLGHDAAGTSLGIAGLVTIVGKLIQGRSSGSKNQA